MAFNTGNPIGSTSPKDLSDNARNLDLLVLGPNSSYPDRKGVPRKSWKGMEGEHNADQIRRESEFDAAQDSRESVFEASQVEKEARFKNFLLSSGYEFVGDYDADGPLILHEINEIFRKDGELWRAKASLVLPYTTVNNWVTDKPKFVSVGDAALRQELGTDTGASMVGQGYPGAGFLSDLQSISRDVINSRLFGIDVNLGLSGSQFTDRMQAMINKAGADEFDIQVGRGEFDSAGPNVVDHTTLNPGSDGISIFGAGSRKTRINYSGTGHCLNVLGQGSEDDSPIKRFRLSDLWIYGNGNTVSAGGIKIDRAYFVDMERVFSSGWSKSDAVAVRVTNVFNFMARMFQFANGFPLPQGQAAFQIGSEGPDTWNTSNVVLLNGACQYSKNNIEVIHNVGVLDNLVVDNVTMGKAGLNSFLSVAANVNNITIRNEHFESPGFSGVGNPLAANATHIKIAKALCVLIENNSQQDARVFLDLDSTPDVIVNLGKFFETGFYDLSGNALFKVRTTTSGVNIQLNAPNIRTDQIDNLLDVVESGGNLVSFDTRWRKAVSEGAWNSLIINQPKLFQSQIINRVGSASGPFDQMYSADGVNWMRMMLSSQYKGERTSIPTSIETSGSWYSNKNAGVPVGEAGSRYNLFGWMCAGGSSWNQMRMPTGA